MNDTPWGRVAAERLQMSVRIAELEAQMAATSPAWGPPQAQPDSDGWWAFEGAFRLTPNKPIDVQVIQLVFDDDIGTMHEWYRGTWRKLLVSPWEVQP